MALEVISGESSFSGRSVLRPLDQITSEADILARFFSMYGQAKEAASDAISRDNKNWMMFLGNHFLTQSGHLQWVEERQSPTHTRYRREIIQPTLELLRSVLVKGFPGIRIKPDYEYANLRSWIDTGSNGNGRFEVQDLHDADVAAWATEFYQNEMIATGESVKQAELICQVLVSGEAYRMRVTHHNPGYGTEIRSKLLKRDQFYGDPRGTDLEQWLDFEYIIIEEELDAATIKRLYGLDERTYSYSAHRRGVAFDESTSLSSTSRAWYPNGSNDNSGAGSWRWDQRFYKVHTVYYNHGNVDATIFGVKNDKSSATLKYPLGREIVIVNFSKVASDTVNPHWHGEFPVTCYQASPLPCMAQGLSEVSKIEDDQIVVDIINNVVLWNALAHSNHTIVYEEGSVNPSHIKNEPGLKLPVRPGGLQQIERWEPAQLNQHLYGFGQDTAQWAQEVVSGATDALRGNQLPAGSSGELYRQNTQAGLNRHSFKGAMLEAGHARDAKLWFYGIQQFADFRAPRYARMHDIGAHQWMPEAVRDLFWDIETTSMADMPISLRERMEVGMLYLQNGWWDLEQMQQFVQMPMRPELRQMVRDVSLEHFIPGIPSNIQAQLRLQAAQLMAQQQTAETGQEGVNLAQGNPPPLPPGNPDQIVR